MSRERTVRETLARSMRVAGAVVVFVWPLPYELLQLHLLAVDDVTAAVGRFLLTRWVLPAALSLMAVGYLLGPPRRPFLRTRLYPLVRVAGGAALWAIGLGFLVTPVALALWEAVRLTAMAAPVAFWRPTIVTTYLFNIAFFPTGLLLLLAARKWAAETEVVV